MKPLCLSPSFVWAEIFPGLYHFPDALTVICGPTSRLALHVDTQAALPSRKTCVLFTLGNRCTSRYATHANYCRVIVLFNLGNRGTPCYATHRNLCGMSMESSRCYPTHVIFLHINFRLSNNYFLWHYFVRILMDSVSLFKFSLRNHI